MRDLEASSLKWKFFSKFCFFSLWFQLFLFFQQHEDFRGLERCTIVTFIPASQPTMNDLCNCLRANRKKRLYQATLHPVNLRDCKILTAPHARLKPIKPIKFMPKWCRKTLTTAIILSNVPAEEKNGAEKPLQTRFLQMGLDSVILSV